MSPGESNDTGSEKPRVVVALSGASGSVYALRLLAVLTAAGHEVYVTVTGGAAKVLLAETGHRFEGRTPKPAELAAAAPGAEAGRIRVFSIDNLAAPVASGSFLHRGMVVVPCSMGTVGRLAHGTSANLLERAADVCLKERRRLILVPRETPLHAIHLENLLALARAGATVLPAMPGYYHRPGSVGDLVDSVVGKIVDQLGVDVTVTRRWGGGR